MSWGSSGHSGLVVIHFVVVEEQAKDCAFHWCIVWVSNGFACEDFDYEKREEG